MRMNPLETFYSLFLNLAQDHVSMRHPLYRVLENMTRISLNPT
jgi:hypothetical protein